MRTWSLPCREKVDQDQDRFRAKMSPQLYPLVHHAATQLVKTELMVGVRLAVPHGWIHFSVWQVGIVSVWDGRRNHFHFWLFFTGQNLSWRCDQSANLQKIRSASRRAMCLVVYARDKPFETSQPSILKVCIPKQPAQASKLGTIITLGIPCLEISK